jgi:cyclomaltodextrinase / maltogenic alpha-amylase / neopullulanase
MSASSPRTSLTIARDDTSALKLACLTMMTYPGAPMIYYGDKIGLEGGCDPDCRRAMLMVCPQARKISQSLAGFVLI